MKVLGVETEAGGGVILDDVEGVEEAIEILHV